MRYWMVIAIGVLLANCGSNQIVYQFKEDRFVYDLDSIPYGNNSKIVAESWASFLTFEFEKGDPMKISVHFNGRLPKVTTIERIDMQLTQKNEKGELITIQPKELQEFHAEYMNGKAIVNVPLKNENISSQVKWQEADWGEYTKNANINMFGTFVFDLDECAEQMVMKFLIKWKDSEKSFETTLTRSNYTAPKLNPKF